MYLDIPGAACIEKRTDIIIGYTPQPRVDICREKGPIPCTAARVPANPAFVPWQGDDGAAGYEAGFTRHEARPVA